MGIRAKILDIETRAEYNGVVYTQGVNIELPTGESMWTLDDELLISEETIGTKKKVELHPTFNISDISVNNDINHGIEVVTSNSGEEHVYSGQIKTISPLGEGENISKVTFKLDVGFGTVQFYLNDLKEIDLTTNENVVISAFITDLKSMTDV